MVLIKRFILMLQFFTSIPVPLNLKVTEKDFGKGLIFAPIVGLMIGGILAGLYKAFDMLFPIQVSSAFIIISYIILTGGLHLDGLGDTFDGIFSNRSRERILEIMRDSRVGTNAVLGIICVILANYVLLGQISQENISAVLVLMPAAGRIGSLMGAGSSYYARKGEGLGKSFIDYCGIREIIIGLVLVLAAFYAAEGFRGMMILPVTIISALVLVKLFEKKLDGITGDVLGAVCELNQTIFLIAVCTIEALSNKLL